MYTMKNVGPRMEILVNTFHPEPLKAITKKTRNKAKYLTQNSIRLKFVKKTSTSNPVESLDLLSVTDQIDPHLLNALAILSDTGVRRSAVDQEDLKPYWKLKKHHISPCDQQAY